MASSDERTQDWVLELHSLGALDDPGRPATLNGDRDDLDSGSGSGASSPSTTLPPRWSTEIPPGGDARGPPPPPPAPGTPTSSPPPAPSPLPGAAECLDFVKARRRGRFRPARQTRLRNNLLAAVGFLEFANAGDFAANVWNETPVPKYALALMIVGGLVALSMIYFSVRDGRLSLANVRALRTERAYLLRQRAALVSGASGGGGDDAVVLADADAGNMVRTLDCFLDMNARELGTELVDRVGMDTLLGFSSLVVGTGTLMATTGDRDGAEFRASNLLTGYIGNAPCAVYGVANLLWSSYVWARARKQQRAALRYVRASTPISQMLRNRTSSLQMHAALNGVGGVVAGAAALVTATMWWGYVVLVPCVVTSGLVNLFWRRCVGYERPLVVREITSIDQDSVLEALRYASTCRERIRRGEQEERRDAFSVLVATGALPDALDVVRKNSLMEALCLRLLHDAGVLERLRSTYPPGPDGVPRVDWDRLLATEDEAWVPILLRAARETINASALRSFIYQERHLLEVLGCYMCRGAEFGRRDKGKKPAGWSHAQPHRNVHSYAGRHTNDWLFGGFSLTGAMRDMFKR